MINILGFVVIRNSVNQLAVSTINTPINFDLEIFDNCDSHDSKVNNSRITVTDNFNVVKFTANCRMAFQAATLYVLTIIKNGVSLTPSVACNGYPSASGNGNTLISLSSYWIPCIKGDFFELQINQNGAGDINILSNSWFMAEFGIY